MTDVAGLLAAFAAVDTPAIQRAAGDRRALIAADIAAALDAGPAEVGRTISRTRQYAAELIDRAGKVRADPTRLAAALALGGPIPTATSDRRAS